MGIRQTVAGAAPTALSDEMSVLGIDHVDWFVGNARQTAMLLRRFGFAVEAHRGLETGQEDHVSWVLRQGEVRLVVTGALHPASPVAAHVREHGDGVRALALRVPDASKAFERAVRAGARPAVELASFTSNGSGSTSVKRARRVMSDARGGLREVA